MLARLPPNAPAALPHAAAPQAVVIPLDTARSTVETRQHQRHLTIMRVAKFHTEGREGLGVVRNLSASGMKMDVYVPMDVGQPLTVSLTDGQQLEATVVWQQNHAVGIRFDRLASVDQLLAVPVKAERGKKVRAPRVSVGQSALLRWSKAAPSKVEIANLSQRGARILTTEALAVNDDVLLELAGLRPLTATVRWTQPGAAGLVFHKVLAVKTLMEWLCASVPAKAEGQGLT